MEDRGALEPRWETAIWLGKSDRSDENIIGREGNIVLARSVRRKTQRKRWNRRMMERLVSVLSSKEGCEH
eukprot:671045-Amphidinium_carterae.1